MAKQWSDSALSMSGSCCILAVRLSKTSREACMKQPLILLLAFVLTVISMTACAVGNSSENSLCQATVIAPPAKEDGSSHR